MDKVLPQIYMVVSTTLGSVFVLTSQHHTVAEAVWPSASAFWTATNHSSLSLGLYTFLSSHHHNQQPTPLLVLSLRISLVELEAVPMGLTVQRQPIAVAVIYYGYKLCS